MIGKVHISDMLVLGLLNANIKLRENALDTSVLGKAGRLKQREIVICIFQGECFLQFLRNYYIANQKFQNKQQHYINSVPGL